MDMKEVLDTAAAMGILADFFDKNGEGAEVVQRGQRAPDTGPLASQGAPALVPVLSYKQRLAQMKEAADAQRVAGAKGRGRKRKSRRPK